MMRPQVANSGAYAQGNAGQFVGGQRNAERQAEENQHGELDETRPAAGERGKYIRY